VENSSLDKIDKYSLELWTNTIYVRCYYISIERLICITFNKHVIIFNKENGRRN